MTSLLLHCSLEEQLLQLFLNFFLLKNSAFCVLHECKIFHRMAASQPPSLHKSATVMPTLYGLPVHSDLPVCVKLTLIASVWLTCMSSHPLQTLYI